MDFGKAFKVFELNILRQSGVVVTPEQVGLKSDPILDLQNKNLTNSPFSTMLNRLGMAQPTLPTAPTDTTDTTAMNAYHQELLAYSQNMQLYNQRFMQLMLQQMQQMQRTMASQKSSTSSSGSDTSGIADTSALGIGGIL